MDRRIDSEFFIGSQYFGRIDLTKVTPEIKIRPEGGKAYFGTPTHMSISIDVEQEIDPLSDPNSIIAGSILLHHITE